MPRKYMKSFMQPEKLIEKKKRSFGSQLSFLILLLIFIITRDSELKFFPVRHLKVSRKNRQLPISWSNIFFFFTSTTRYEIFVLSRERRFHFTRFYKCTSLFHKYSKAWQVEPEVPRTLALSFMLILFSAHVRFARTTWRWEEEDAREGGGGGGDEGEGWGCARRIDPYYTPQWRWNGVTRKPSKMRSTGNPTRWLCANH